MLLNFSFQQVLMAQRAPRHVVPPEELQNRLVTQSASRMENMQEIRRLLHHDLVQKEVGNLFDLQRVELALNSLDDTTLALMAERSREVNDRLQGGMSSSKTALIVIIAGVVFLVLYIAVSVTDDQ
jgi:hypothetical protein